MKSVRVTDALKGLDFQLLLAQGVAKGEGGRPKNKNRNKKRVRGTILIISVEHLQWFFIFWYSNKCGKYVEAKLWLPFIILSPIRSKNTCYFAEKLTGLIVLPINGN